MRTFKTVRTYDVSGVSGTGIVAEGVEFTSGEVVLHWLTDISSVTLFNSIEDLITIHGHEGSTQVSVGRYELLLRAGVATISNRWYTFLYDIFMLQCYL